MAGELGWQLSFVTLALVINLVISVLCTYLIERPWPASSAAGENKEISA